MYRNFHFIIPKYSIFVYFFPICFYEFNPEPLLEGRANGQDQVSLTNGVRGGQINPIEA